MLFLDSDDSEDGIYILNHDADHDDFITDDDSDWYEDGSSGSEEVWNDTMICWPKITDQARIL